MIRELGYDIDERIVTASKHGVAQRRTRLFLIATRRGVTVRPLRVQEQEPAFEPLLETNVPDHLWVPVAAATPGVQARIAKGRANHGRRFLTQHVTGHPGVPLHEPIRTITTAHSHWNLVDGDYYRALTSRELARGMGFRDTYTWDEDLSIGDVTRGIGNAVCPPVATGSCPPSPRASTRPWPPEHRHTRQVEVLARSTAGGTMSPRQREAPAAAR